MTEWKKDVILMLMEERKVLQKDFRCFEKEVGSS